MLYLLDANVLIDANNKYYPIEKVPEFWGWLVHLGSTENAKIPVEVYEKIKKGDDTLAEWLKEQNISDALLFREEVNVQFLQTVMDNGYAPDLTDVESEKIGEDPFLIAYCMMDLERRCIVTTEVSKPKRLRANRHIPDVCQTMGVQCVDTFAFLRQMDFNTSWGRGR